MRLAWTGLFLVIYLLCSPHLVSADYLEVRRNANVYKEPNRRSEQLTRLEVTDRQGPLLVPLLQDSKVNGYYQIRVPGRTDKGWIYKTLVRRYSGQHPAYRPYKRSLYRHWIDEDGDCQNTRAEVLIRDDDDGVVGFKPPDQCLVTTGIWLDPYTGETFTNAKHLDVDHVVPLKNAHESGAWAWSPQRRHAFANYLKDERHLLAVKASENRKKGAKGPDQYLPPLQSYHCEYVKVWLNIKQEWELEISEDEGEAIQKELSTCP